jgi:hypothetical protein
MKTAVLCLFPRVIFLSYLTDSLRFQHSLHKRMRSTKYHNIDLKGQQSYGLSIVYKAENIIRELIDYAKSILIALLL